MRFLSVALLASLLLASPAAAADEATLAAAIQKLAEDYLARRAGPEHITGVSISLSRAAGAGALNAVAGTVARDAGAAAMTPDTLFQIGSITKSMTAATLLQLQTEGRLSLDDRLGEHLPAYPAWKDITLRRLLTMTSGIPSYDRTDAMIGDVVKYGLARHYDPAVLVGFVDPAYPGAPAATTGYDYSNTNYILAGMVISRVTGRSVSTEFHDRFLGERYGLTDMYYADGPYPAEVIDRLAAGYNWQPSEPRLKSLLGGNFKTQDMSWAGSAGALVATPEQVTRWARTLYQSDALTDEARTELLDVVSMKTGDRIGRPTADDPAGFGLGVLGFDSPALGAGWEYEGGAMGFRVVYLYLPERDLVVAVGLNSNVDDDQDQIGKLAAAVLQEAMK